MEGNKMKAKKIASLLLTASIALTASACTVEFKDPDGTVDKVVNALASETADDQAEEQDDSEEQDDKESASTKSDDATDARATEKTEKADTTEKTEKTENTETTEATEEKTSDNNKADKTTEETSATTETSTTSNETTRTLIKEDVCLLFNNPEHLTYTLDSKHGKFEVDPGDDDIIITMDGKKFELPITWDGKEVWPFNVNYVQRDGKEYLYIGSSIQAAKGFYHNLNIYKIDGNNITYVNSVEGFSVRLGDPLAFTGCLEETEDYGYGINGTYEVGPDGMPVRNDDLMTFTDVCDAVSFSEEVTGYLVVNDQVTNETASVSPDEYVRLFSTNGKDYLEVAKKDGTRIRLDWTSVFKACDKNDQFYIAHAIDANIDSRIACYEF